MKAEKPKQLKARSHFRRATAYVASALSAFGMATMGVLAHQPAEPIKHAIDKKQLLSLVGNSFREGRIDLYQAVLLLETNCNRGAVNKIDHPLKIIDLHNDKKVDFSHKTGTLLQTLLEKRDYSYDELLSSGILKKPSYQLTADLTGNPDFTLDDIYLDNGIQLALPQAMHSNGQERDEPVSSNPVIRSFKPTFSAIPKHIFLDLVTSAMQSGRMNYMQATMMFSVNSHSLEKRKNGSRYLDHPMAVAAGEGLTKDQRFLALVHDVIENSNYTLEDFKKARIPEYMIYALDGVTIRPDEKDDYEHFPLERLRDLAKQNPCEIKNYYSFIERCSLNVHSMAVKKADILHNLRDNPKPHKIPEYKLALAYLTAVENNEIKPGSSLREWAENHRSKNIRDYYEGAIQRRHDKLHESLASAELAAYLAITERNNGNFFADAYQDAVEQGKIKAGFPIKDWANNHADPQIKAYYTEAIALRSQVLNEVSPLIVRFTKARLGVPTAINPLPFTPGGEPPTETPSFGGTH